MPTNYVLIDFENVQPKNLEILESHPFKIFVFVGANQTKVPFDLASTMQKFGENAQYIKISGNGKNALDFHIALYLGKLSSQDPEGFFHVISKDTGFDPLIKHLRENKVRAHRENDLAEIPVLQISSATNLEEKVQAIVKNLISRGQSRPRKVKTLSNTINTLFTKNLEQPELDKILRMLQKNQFISVTNTNVTYSLPKCIKA